jgi:hypothetical protein
MEPEFKDYRIKLRQYDYKVLYRQTGFQLVVGSNYFLFPNKRNKNRNILMKSK